MEAVIFENWALVAVMISEPGYGGRVMISEPGYDGRVMISEPGYDAVEL